MDAHIVLVHLFPSNHNEQVQNWILCFVELKYLHVTKMMSWANWELTKKTMKNLVVLKNVINGVSLSHTTVFYFFWVLVEFPYNPCIFVLIDSNAIICHTYRYNELSQINWWKPTPGIFDKYLLFPRARINWTRSNRYRIRRNVKVIRLLWILGILKSSRWLVLTKYPL